MKTLIVGAGKLGSAIVASMIGGYNEITVIDKSDEVISKISDRYDIQTLTGNALDVETLRSINAGSYDLTVAATQSDELNMTVCRFAKELGCRKTVARVRDPEFSNHMDFVKSAMKIDYLLDPDKACAMEIFTYLTEKYSIKGGRIVSGKTVILECSAESLPKIVGKEIKASSKLLGGALIAAISRNGKIIIPGGNTSIQSDDIIYITGPESIINRIGIASRRKEDAGIKKVMIAGGGNTAYHLASMLEALGISVKIIEKDIDRCEYLSTHLESTLILNGDATDSNLLREENLEGMDAFAALTGFDEENLLMSIVAKKAGVDDVATKMSHDSYAALTDELGVDMVINPMSISASALLRYMERDSIVVFSQIIQGQAEFVEISAEDGMPLVGKKLMELQIPEGIIIASVNRNGQIITPKGQTVIESKDKVTILSLLSSLPALEALLKR